MSSRRLMRKHPLSLLEVMIGLVLTAILITFLFSSFRELMITKRKMSVLRQEKHREHVVQIRLSQIFESINTGSLFLTEPYRDLSPQALHFVFNNRLDADPEFCNELEGFLFLNQKKELCLITESKKGKTRKEIFFKNGFDYTIHFFDPNLKKWIQEWENTVLPPFVQICISGKQFQFLLPHGNRVVVY